MANLIQSLFRIDPTQGLVQYVQAIKPYHTKILDVLVEYVYTEAISATVTDKLSWRMEWTRPDVDVVYNCGYGLIWDPYRTDEANPSAFIISAQAAEGSGVIPANTFLVQPSPGSPFDAAVINTQSNQLAFVTSYVIQGVIPASNTWIVQGDITSVLTVNQKIYVTGNTGTGANGSYVIASFSLVSGDTHVVMQSGISLLAASDGTFNVPLPLADLPLWNSGLEVQVTTTGVLPEPLSTTGKFYFIPTNVAGVFNLAKKRYPTQFTDYIDLTTLGTGIMSIHRSETFFPGAYVKVTGSYLGKNDGNYVISKSEPEGANVRLFVLQKVPYTTPSTLTSDGAMIFNFDSYDAPEYCPLAQAPDLYASAYIHESIQFSFTMTFAESMIANVSEIPADGFGIEPFSGGPYSLFGNGGLDHNSGTTVTSGQRGVAVTHMIMPHGYDVQFFDIGPMVESIETVSQNYGTSV